MADQTEQSAEPVEAPALPAELAAEPTILSEGVTDEARAVEADKADDAWLNDNEDASYDAFADPEVAVEEAPAETKAPAEAPAEAPDEDESSLSDAYAVLRRAGLDIEDIQSLPDARVLAIAEKQSKIQSDLDSRFRDQTAQSPGDATVTPEDSTDPPQQRAEATVDSPLDMAALASPLVEALALDEEGAAALVEFQKQAMGPLLATIQQQRDTIYQTQMGLLQIEERTSREGLVERFPQLADAESAEYTRVTDRMKTLSDSGQYTSMTKLMEDAASIEFAREMKAEVEKASQKLSSLKSAGQPVTATAPADAPVGTLSQDEVDNQVLDALESGDPVQIARARAMAGQ